MTYFEATVHALKSWALFQGCQHYYKVAKIYCDNFATMSFSKNNKYSKGVKHIELKYFVTKEKITKRVSIKYVRANLMIAD